jgi:hypothetical protein
MAMVAHQAQEYVPGPLEPDFPAGALPLGRRTSLGIAPDVDSEWPAFDHPEGAEVRVVAPGMSRR